MQFDELPELPVFDDCDYYQEDQNEAIKEFINAGRKFMFYETNDRKFNFFFENLDEQLYAGFVVTFSNMKNSHENVYRFLKLSVEGARLIKHATQQSIKSAYKIENYFRSKNV